MLSLKEEYKKKFGQEWKQSAAPAPVAVPAPVVAAASPSNDLDNKIKVQGELIRDLKAKKAAKVLTYF